MYTFSLIIPHYNIPGLLQRLLITVPVRDDLQIIVVDDMSTMDLEEFETLKTKFSHVEWFSTESNGGGGKARNIGLQKAKGKYVFFADADDFFFPNFNQLLENCKNKDFDILFFNVTSLYSSTLLPSYRANHVNEFFNLAESDEELAILKFRYLFGEPWCKIIKKEIIDKNNIRFEELPNHNDTLFSYMTGHFAKEIILDPVSYYCITARENSVSLQFSEKNILIRQEVFAKKHQFLKKNNIPLIDDLLISPYFLSKGNKDMQSKINNILSENGISWKEYKNLINNYIRQSRKKRIKGILKKFRTILKR